MAMRMAISRARSAVRAANRLPRLTQAASSTMPASTITPVRKLRAGPPPVSPTRPARDSLKPSFSSCRILPPDARRNRAQFRPRLSRRDAVQRTMEKGCVACLFSSQLNPLSEFSFARGTNRDGLQKLLGAGEAPLRDAHDGIGMLVDADASAYDMGVGAKIVVPRLPGEHGGLGRLRMVVIR